MAGDWPDLKFQKNINTALDIIAPIKTINIRRVISPWKLDKDLMDQKILEQEKWKIWGQNLTEENKTRC